MGVIALRVPAASAPADEWGIQPLPATARTLTTFDSAALWSNLALSLVLLVVGSMLVPGLSVPKAALAIVVGAGIGSLLLALAAVIGADTGLPTMVLYRAPFGKSGAYLISLLAVGRAVVWGTFYLVLLSSAAAAIMEHVVGVGARPFWVVAFGAIGVYMSVKGPQAMVRTFFRKFAWIALAFVAVFTLYGFLILGIPSYLTRPYASGWPSFWQGVDLVAVVPLAWLPLAADYSRFARGPRAAFAGTLVGSFVGVAWFTLLGALFIPSVRTSDVIGFLLSLGAAGLALLLLLDANEPFASLYSASVSIRNMIPGVRQSAAAPVVGALCVLLAFGADLWEYDDLLVILGSLFVPLFGVVAADYFVLRRRRLDHAVLFGRQRRVVLGINVLALAVWVGGFLLYNAISPSHIEWWRDAMNAIIGDLLRLPTDLGDRHPWLSATIAAFLATFVGYSVIGVLARTRAVQTRPPLRPPRDPSVARAGGSPRD